MSKTYPEIAIGSTSRLDIKPMTLEQDDYWAWIPFFNDKECTKFYKLNQQDPPLTNAISWVNSHVHAYNTEKYGQLSLFLKNSDNIIGSCGLIIQNLDGQIITELGYAILPQFQNQGYATEAAKYFVELYETKLRQNPEERLHSLIRTDNEPSREVAEKIGMKLSDITQWQGMTMYVYQYPYVNNMKYRQLSTETVGTRGKNQPIFIKK